MRQQAFVSLLAAIVAAAGCSRSSDQQRPAAGAQEKASPAAGSGFAVTGGSPAARSHFARGLGALHAFWYDEATREFQAAIDADPDFSMAYWGLAMSQAKLLWGDDRVGEARAILARLPHPDRLSARERAWIEAARVLFAGGDVRSSRDAFARAMEAVHDQYPDDDSAAFLSIALIAALDPGAPDEATVRERAGALAADLFARNPQHPGAAHYLIHAFDTPALAARALPAARAYAANAPDAFHARHMPAHVFARLGMWKEAIASCRSAWDASLAAARRHQLGADHDDFHSLSWIIEMSFELGRRAEADAAMKLFADAVRAGLSPQNRTAYAGQVVSYLGRTGEWKRADELLAVLDVAAAAAPGAATGAAVTPRSPDSAPGAASCSGHPQAAGVDGMLELFERRAVAVTRARAAAALRDRARTRALLDEVTAIDGQLHDMLIRTQPPELVARQERMNDLSRRTLTARAAGDLRGLLAGLEEMERTAPERSGDGDNAFLRAETRADALLELGRAGEALAAYQEVLRDHPGRSHSILGAARSARRAGKPDLARELYAALVEQWQEADAGTPGLAEARAALR